MSVWTEERNARALEMRAAGISINDIAKEFGVHRSGVGRHLALLVETPEQRAERLKKLRDKYGSENPRGESGGTWEAEHDSKLLEMTAAGYSYGLIAKELNRTRMSVIGRSRRLGLAKPKALIQRPATKRTVSGTWRIKVVKPKAPEPEYLEPLNKTLDDLQRDDCRYINGDASDPRYCGHPIFKRSYCAFHFRLCYTSAEARPSNPSAFSSGFGRRAA